MKEINFEFNGYSATVIIPDKPNGKWIWKTEFLHAFEDAELALFDKGYTRVTYKIHDMWGSPRAVRMMNKFHKFAVKEFNLSEKAILFGFSRGGTYAFNYALFYPDFVEKVYLDAPVLDLGTLTGPGEHLLAQVYDEYSLTEETVKSFKGHPICNLREFFDAKIPLLLIAGGSDEVVPFDTNAKKLIEFCDENGIEITSAVKPDCKHHPHSLEDISPIIDFIDAK
ncbi:MAG: alpha/beta hydrolase [Ruminococcaceae bacterium]|nr:alpha/beta hydrolase [Oscillospiraceae bacterium]